MELKDSTTRRDIALEIAKSIRPKFDILEGETKHIKNENYIRTSMRVQLGTHQVLESIAEVLEVDETWFKQVCGVGQSLAYFI